MRGTSRYVAGSRFKYTPQRIGFTYDNLVNAIGDAIDMQAKENNGELVTDERTKAYEVAPEENFNEVMGNIRSMISKIQTNVPKEDFNNTWKHTITEITDKYLGAGKRVSDCTPAQIEQLTLIASDLTDVIGDFDFSIYNK